MKAVTKEQKENLNKLKELLKKNTALPGTVARLLEVDSFNFTLCLLAIKKDKEALRLIPEEARTKEMLKIAA